VVVTFVPTVEEQYRVWQSIRREKRWRRVMDVGMPVVFAANAWLTSRYSAPWTAVWMAALAYWLLRPRLWRWQIARNRRSNPVMGGAHTFTVSPAELRLSTPTADIALAWSGIVRARETPDAFLLYASRDWAYFIPRRALREADEGRLRAILAGRLGERAELRG
jgi:hypothetical protein